MTNQLVNFESGSPTTGDSGEREDAAAVKPVQAGEAVRQSVISRPTENLRARTEALRSEVEDLLYRADADRWLITAGNNMGVSSTPEFPTVTWNEAAGTFVVSSALVVQPLMSPETDKFAEKLYTFTSGMDTATFDFASILYDYQKANDLRIVWEELPTAEIAGGYCEAFLEGTPAHILRIVIRDDGNTQATHVDAVLTALGPLDPFACAYAGVGSVYVVLADIPVEDRDFQLVGTYSRELHHLPTAELATFFGTHSLAADGDTLGIYFPFLVDPDPLTSGGRRQATPTSGATPPNTDVTAAQLFLASEEPEKIPYAVPLCKRVGTYLVFVDGTVAPTGQVTTFGGNGAFDSLLARYEAHVGGTAEQHDAVDVLFDSTALVALGYDATTETQGAVDQVATDLADDTDPLKGSGLVGAAAVLDTPESWAGGGTLLQILTEIYGHLNDRTERDTAEIVTQGWVFAEDIEFEKGFHASSGGMLSGSAGVAAPQQGVGRWNGGRLLQSANDAFVGSTVNASWSFPWYAANVSSSAGVWITDLAVLSIPNVLRGMPLIAFVTLGGEVYIRETVEPADSVAAYTLPVNHVGLSICSDGEKLYVLSMRATDGFSFVSRYSFDGVSSWVQDWITATGGTAFLDPLSPVLTTLYRNRIVVANENTVVALHGGPVDANTLVALNRDTGLVSWSGCGSAPLGLYPTGALATTGYNVDPDLCWIGFATADGKLQAALQSSGLIPALYPLGGFDVNCELLPGTFGGATADPSDYDLHVADIVFDGHAFWWLTGAGILGRAPLHLVGTSLPPTPTAMRAGITAYNNSAQATLQTFGFPGFAGFLATDGFQLYAQSGGVDPATDLRFVDVFSATGGSPLQWSGLLSSVVTGSFQYGKIAQTSRLLSDRDMPHWEVAFGNSRELIGRAVHDGTHLWLTAYINTGGRGWDAVYRLAYAGQQA